MTTTGRHGGWRRGHGLGRGRFFRRGFAFRPGAIVSWPAQTFSPSWYWWAYQQQLAQLNQLQAQPAADTDPALVEAIQELIEEIDELQGALAAHGIAVQIGAGTGQIAREVAQYGSRVFVPRSPQSDPVPGLEHLIIFGYPTAAEIEPLAHVERPGLGQRVVIDTAPTRAVGLGTVGPDGRSYRYAYGWTLSVPEIGDDGAPAVPVGIHFYSNQIASTTPPTDAVAARRACMVIGGVVQPTAVCTPYVPVSAIVARDVPFPTYGTTVTGPPLRAGRASGAAPYAAPTDAPTLFAQWQGAIRGGRLPQVAIDALYRKYSAAAAAEGRPPVDPSYRGPLPVPSGGAGFTPATGLMGWYPQTGQQTIEAGSPIEITVEGSPSPPFTARVNQTFLDPMGGALVSLRVAPHSSAPQIQRLTNGQLVDVIQTRIPQQQGQPGFSSLCPQCEWWHVQTGGGMRGYVLARGPQGEWNFERVRALRAGRVTPGAAPYAAPTDAPTLFAQWQGAIRGGRLPQVAIDALYRKYSAAAAAERRPSVDPSYRGPLPMPSGGAGFTPATGLDYGSYTGQMLVLRCGPDGCEVKATPDASAPTAIALPANHPVTILEQPTTARPWWRVSFSVGGGTSSGWVHESEWPPGPRGPHGQPGPLAPPFGAPGPGGFVPSPLPGPDGFVPPAPAPGPRQWGPPLRAGRVTPGAPPYVAPTDAPTLFAQWQGAIQGGKLPQVAINALYQKYSAAAAREGRFPVDPSYRGALPGFGGGAGFTPQATPGTGQFMFPQPDYYGPPLGFAG